TKAENTFKIVPSMQKIVPTINNFEDKIIEFSNITNDIIEFNENLSDSDLDKIKRDLIEWKSNHNETRDQMKRLEYFVDLKRFYIDLWNLAKRSLGDPSPKKLRGWVSLYIRSCTCNNSDRIERKMWNSLCLLDAILTHGTVTCNSLIEKG
ncbi:19713_t:CDS:1, partial [Gigaspora margarita]